MQKQPGLTKTEAKNSSGGAGYILCLFIAGSSPNSSRAITNLKHICEMHLAGKYTLQIIDVYQQGPLAIKEQLVALPMLVRKFPLPERRMIGDLSDTAKVLTGLGINL